MSVFRVKSEPGKEPRDWTVEKFATIDGDEKFIRDMCELKTVLHATMIFGKQREDADDAIGSILFDGLMPAFSELQKIRAGAGKDLPIMDRRELYHNFYGKLWKSYKELTQRAATVIGFNIGFLFSSNSDFKKGLKEFESAYPAVRPELGAGLANARKRWQNDLALFRNTLVEHPQGDPDRFGKYYDLQCAEFLFEEVWNSIVDLIAVLLESKLSGGTKLALPDPRTLPNWRNRFVFDVPALRNLK